MKKKRIFSAVLVTVLTICVFCLCFYVSGNVAGSLQEASRLLRKGGKLVFSDVTENVVQLLSDCRKAGFAVR